MVLVCQCDAIVVIILSDEPRQNQGRGLVDQKLVKASTHTHTHTHLNNFIACRQKAALLFWFFGDFRCGVWLFIVILVIYKYRIGKIDIEY